jgi:hypothetical protein
MRGRYSVPIDRREIYQTWRDAVQSARVLTETTGVRHSAAMQPDGTLIVKRG